MRISILEVSELFLHRVCVYQLANRVSTWLWNYHYHLRADEEAGEQGDNSRERQTKSRKGDIILILHSIFSTD